jgi:hypothetical protein
MAAQRQELAIRTKIPAAATRNRDMLAEANHTQAIVVWSLLLIGLIVAGWLTVWQVKRRLQQDDVSGNSGFTLSDLRQLHKSGQMTDEEFERAKARVVDAARRAALRDAAGGKDAGGDAGATPPAGP